MRKILITGAAGNVGGALANKLVQDSDNFVIAVDNFRTGKPHKLPDLNLKNFRFVKADVNNYNDIAPIITSNCFDYIFHYAALVGVQRTLNNPISVLNDIEGIKNILILAKSTSVKRVFYSSSSEVYGEPVEFPQNEKTTPLNSRLTYAVVKNIGESYFRAYQQEYDLQYTIFRFFNTYGPNQSEDFVVPRFIKLAKTNQPITIYGKGDQTRTFCYIDDNIDSCIAALNSNSFINDVVNIGNDTETSVFDLAKLILDLTKSKSEIKFLPPLTEGDMTRRQPDVTKMKGLLKRDFTSLENGIKKLI